MHTLATHHGSYFCKWTGQMLGEKTTLIEAEWNVMYAPGSLEKRATWRDTNAWMNRVNHCVSRKVLPNIKLATNGSKVEEVWLYTDAGLQRSRHMHMLQGKWIVIWRTCTASTSTEPWAFHLQNLQKTSGSASRAQLQLHIVWWLPCSASKFCELSMSHYKLQKQVHSRGYKETIRATHGFSRCTPIQVYQWQLYYNCSTANVAKHISISLCTRAPAPFQKPIHRLNLHYCKS